MPDLHFRVRGESTFQQLASVFLGFGVILPAIAWAASNYVATPSSFLYGFAFRDLSAFGLFGIVAGGFARLLGKQFRGS